MRKRTVLSNPVGTSYAGTLFIDRDTFNEVINFARAAGLNEVCGFISVRRNSPRSFTVIEGSLNLPDQYTGKSLSQTAPMGELTQMEYENTFGDDPDVFRLLWHSHKDGGAGFSVTDTSAHDEMSRTTAFEAMMFMVVNVHGQATANLEVYRPFRIGTQLRLVVIENEEEADLGPYKELIAQHCQLLPKEEPSASDRSWFALADAHDRKA